MLFWSEGVRPSQIPRRAWFWVEQRFSVALLNLRNPGFSRRGFAVAGCYDFRVGAFLRIVGWLACVVYSTVPLFWLMIHPFADRWRARKRSPYRVLVPAWIAMWAATAQITAPWRNVVLYRTAWVWIPAVLLFALGLFIYSRSGKNFSAKQLGGLPEVQGNHREQRLATGGIRSRIRHPLYAAHLCQMAAWSIGSGLAVCWGLTAFAIVTGALMIRMEDKELEQRFGDAYRLYRNSVPAVIPRA